MNIKTDITLEDFNIFYKNTANDKFKSKSNAWVLSSIKNIILWVIIALVILSIRDQVFSDRGDFDLYSAAVGALPFVIFIGAYIVYYIKILKKMQPLTNGMILGQHDLELSETGITEKGTYFKTNSKWAGVVDFQNDDNSYYIFIDSIAAHIIPKRSFSSKEQENAFFEYVTKQIERST